MTARIRPTVCGRVLARSSTPEGADRIHLGIPNCDSNKHCLRLVMTLPSLLSKFFWDLCPRPLWPIGQHTSLGRHPAGADNEGGAPRLRYLERHLGRVQVTRIANEPTPTHLRTGSKLINPPLSLGQCRSGKGLTFR